MDIFAPAEGILGKFDWLEQNLADVEVNGGWLFPDFTGVHGHRNNLLKAAIICPNMVLPKGGLAKISKSLFALDPFDFPPRTSRPSGSRDTLSTGLSLMSRGGSGQSSTSRPSPYRRASASVSPTRTSTSLGTGCATPTRRRRRRPPQASGPKDPGSGCRHTAWPGTTRAAPAGTGRGPGRSSCESASFATSARLWVTVTGRPTAASGRRYRRGPPAGTPFSGERTGPSPRAIKAKARQTPSLDPPFVLFVFLFY